MRTTLSVAAYRAMTTPAPAETTTSAPRWWVEPALILAFWTAMAVLTAVGQLLDPRAGFLKPVFPAASVGLAFTGAYLWAALTRPIFRLSRRYSFERGHWHTNVLALLGVGVVIAIGMEIVVSYLRFEVFFSPRDRAFGYNPLFGLKRLFWLDDFVVYLAVLAVGFARDYFHRLQKRHDEAVELEAERARLQAEAARLEAQLAEARLAALRAQLDPHFLFNTLNAVSSLVGSDPRGVRRMIARLSALLRHTLEESTEPEVPLAQELAVLGQYVEIMEIRFEGRLHVDTSVDPAALDALVPNLVLQPLVENAIKHGVSKLPNAAVGRVAVTVRRAGDDVVLSVRDNGPAIDDADALARPGGVGLRNTRERLTQLYGPEHTLTLTAAPGGGVVAELTLPYHTRADLHAAGVAAVDDDATPAALGAVGAESAARG
ncbi:histidine kinase internal region (plasmid) [Gemmatirosa kalamazoonensis]|uniref:Histidine kinase internal region n=1 Tax=Gemmatirosa kalamazoonensis TaxID=861299 RepID=W0RQP4_9BACT|nr:histidine kinase [Gemmatirosa kalamazoonensis]AHG92655.1 histidine kinase internal region [Gemmatirosa kalamazoonensis]